MSLEKTPDAKPSANERIEPLSKTSGKLIIAVDPRIELLAVIQHLVGSDMVQADSEGYAAAVDAWFADYKKHPVFERYLALEANGFCYDLAVSCFLRFDGVPLIKQVCTWDSSMVFMNEERLTGVSEGGSIEDFYRDVNDFALKGNFAGFFTSQREFLARKINAVDSLLAKKPDLISHLVDWYGYSHGSYTFVLSPLIINNGYGFLLVDEQGKACVYCVTALESDEMSIESLYYFALMLFHEISHSYVNSLVDAHYDQFACAKALYEPINKKMEAQAYDSWWIAVAEHFVRASATRLLELYFLPEERSSSLESEMNLGFIYIDNIYAGLLEYEQARRETGIRYDEYFPQLVESFVQLAEDPETAISDRLGFKGPLNSVAIGQIVAIHPDPQRVEGVEENIMPIIDFLVERLKVEVYTDTQALKLDLKDKNIYVYGAWGTNMWLEKYLDLLPFKILPDRVIADKEYAGTGLRIAACLPHPQNPELGMAVYTGQTTASMKGSNAFFHGPEDWYVTDTNQTVLGKGNFTGKNAVWKF
ncbi:MAG: DUF4932 domain-containing protein [Candidatus Cloacimonetes bacterium]|nr:DUF4932 domain-containing protein [Candidatus Cloacimonadota bacterium]